MVGLFEKSSGSVVITLQFGTLQLTKAGLSIKIPGFSSKVHVKPSFQCPFPSKFPLNQTQHFVVFKEVFDSLHINNNLYPLIC